MCAGVVAFLVVILSAKFVAEGLEPDFLRPLENVTIAQGRDATFTCVVNNLGGYRVSGGTHQPRVAWIKADTKAILAIHEHVITHNHRLSVTHNDDNTWTLNMKAVTREDRGTYMCQVNTDPMKSQSAFLEVVIPPDIISEETSGDMMIPEGGSAKLICKARGYPPPRITWRREDANDIIIRTAAGKSKVASVEGEVLVLNKVTRSEMGNYMCIASNGVPPSVSKRLMLHVHFHPMIQVPNQLVGAPSGTDVTLHCSVEASPKAINYWTRQTGEMIIRNAKYVMEEKAGAYYSSVMYLTIKNIRKSDLGGYKCVSKNSIGDAEGTIRLYAMELKKKLPDVGDTDDEENAIQNGSQGSLREGEDQIAVQGRPQIPSSRSSSLWSSSVWSSFSLIFLSFILYTRQNIPLYFVPRACSYSTIN